MGIDWAFTLLPLGCKVKQKLRVLSLACPAQLGVVFGTDKKARWLSKELVQRSLDVLLKARLCLGLGGAGRFVKRKKHEGYTAAGVCKRILGLVNLLGGNES
jgi:hypothetical protein